MFPVILERLRQGQRTSAFPLELPLMPERYRGLPVLDSSRCPPECQECASACPTDAIGQDDTSAASMGRWRIDLGRCLFCTDCIDACPEGAIRYTHEFRLATRRREDLLLSGQGLRLATALDLQMRRLFQRSLKLRQVSAGGCNACEADVNVLNTVVFDLGRFGIQFVASPRHADGLLITGPVTENMKQALLMTYDAVPAPKIVIAVGACAISGGPYAGFAEQHDGAASLLPVDLFVPGCPPHPYTILDGLLRLLGTIGNRSRDGEQ